ncbi:MAG: helix-turn-helix transcriptional regulator [Sulfolobales archaeon]|nr:PadR family transcriptional regulator [Sulfolobales archaeon]MDW8082422.1 helix-turn-helix transcriptional regulator [Sulfolobales archaeon]
MGESRAYERLIRKLTTEVLWIYVARILLESQSLKAYEIKKKITEKFGIKPRTMTTYTVIYRMSREGLIKPVKVNGDTVYELTEAGKREFNEAVKFLERMVEYLKRSPERI